MLAKRIVEGDVPEVSRMQPSSPDLGHALGRKRYRGDFEERLSRSSRSLSFPGPFSPSTRSTRHRRGVPPSAAPWAPRTLLKPGPLSRARSAAMARPPTRSYRQFFEKDRRLVRRFQKIDVNEPTVEDAIES